MLREIVLDTETTGLDPSTGDRIVEIGAVELLNGVPSGSTFHVYLNPQRDVPAEAVRIHGLTAEFLSDKPLFGQIVDDFLDFIGEDRLVIHNAEFDMRFINAELALQKRAALPAGRALDTLPLARRRHPGASATLDALCARYGIDTSRRKKHGALLDSELLAEVYLELNGGRQSTFSLQTAAKEKIKLDTSGLIDRRPAPLASRLTQEEVAAHETLIDRIGAKAMWRRQN